MIDLSSNNLINEDKSIVGALDYISQQIMQRQNLTFILTEVTDIQEDSITARHFLDLVTLAEERGAVIIVISNNPIWKQLQRLGMSLKLDLPDEDEIYKIIKESKYVVSFTGAGISVESGVPPFRGENGLWEKHGSQFAEISYFVKHQKDHRDRE